MKDFKPQLLPNNPVGESMDWGAILKNNVKEYMVSHKYDGARVELQYDTKAKGRSLKTIPNDHIQRMHKELAKNIGPYGGILEAEFYSPEMNFSEIMHFFKTEDIASNKTLLKYKNLWEKSDGGQNLSIWEYPGRDWQWLTTWHDSLKFYLFDYYLQDGLNKFDRYQILQEFTDSAECPHLYLIDQFQCKTVDELYQSYDKALLEGAEGLVMIHHESIYKFGRHTLNSRNAYKIKEDNLQFDGKILSVVEGTIAREGAEKTINELGRSKTSQLKEDRISSGIASGFEVLMEDGNTLIVSLKGYDHSERRQLLYDHADYSNKWIRFTGMAPVKTGGCPRHAHYTRGNLRDDK